MRLTAEYEAVNCIVTERIRWMIQRGEDGAAVDKCATLQVSALSGTARDVVIGQFLIINATK